MRKYIVAGALLVSTSAWAQGSCEQLWIERNAVFKEAGYCFKTARAIREFGNAGCEYDVLEDVPLSRAQQRDVARIQRAERALRCPR